MRTSFRYHTPLISRHENTASTTSVIGAYTC